MNDFGAREELRQRMADKLRQITTDEVLVDSFMEAVMPLFHLVVDEWDRVDTSTYTAESWLDQRWLVARIPVQSQAYERKPDRSVRS